MKHMWNYEKEERKKKIKDNPSYSFYMKKKNKSQIKIHTTESKACQLI